MNNILAVEKCCVSAGLQNSVCDVCVGGKSQLYGSNCEIMCNNDNLFFSASSCLQ